MFLILLSPKSITLVHSNKLYHPSSYSFSLSFFLLVLELITLDFPPDFSKFSCVRFFAVSHKLRDLIFFFVLIPLVIRCPLNSVYFAPVFKNFAPFPKNSEKRQKSYIQKNQFQTYTNPILQSYLNLICLIII